jgi:hypothetical protein
MEVMPPWMGFAWIVCKIFMARVILKIKNLVVVPI